MTCPTVTIDNFIEMKRHIIIDRYLPVTVTMLVLVLVLLVVGVSIELEVVPIDVFQYRLVSLVALLVEALLSASSWSSSSPQG
jgi:hypothetical protein